VITRRSLNESKRWQQTSASLVGGFARASRKWCSSNSARRRSKCESRSLRPLPGVRELGVMIERIAQLNTFTFYTSAADRARLRARRSAKHPPTGTRRGRERRPNRRRHGRATRDGGCGLVALAAPSPLPQKSRRRCAAQQAGRFESSLVRRAEVSRLRDGPRWRTVGERVTAACGLCVDPNAAGRLARPALSPTAPQPLRAAAHFRFDAPVMIEASRLLCCASAPGSSEAQRRGRGERDLARIRRHGWRGRVGGVGSSAHGRGRVP